MERLLGVCALAFSMSVFAQEDPQNYQQDQQEYRQDAQQGQASERSDDAWPAAESTPQVEDQQARDEEMEQSAGAEQQAQTSQQAEGEALKDLADQHDNLSTFVQALQETGLADAVAQGQYTAFAPTNEAFEAADRKIEELMKPENREELVELLRNHLVADNVDAAQAKELSEALTVGGATLQLAQTDGELTVNGAKVKETDIRSGGLIVHTIDEVLQPEPGEGAAVAQQGSDEMDHEMDQKDAETAEAQSTEQDPQVAQDGTDEEEALDEEALDQN